MNKTVRKRDDKHHTNSMPPELLVSLQINSETFAEIIKLQTAIALFKQGKISSGMAVRWLEIPRVNFLMQAMEAGAELLENSQDDFERKTTLIGIMKSSLTQTQI